jgi:hypothetical protein
MGVKHDSVWNRFEVPHLAPDRHAKKEAEVKDSSDLRDDVQKWRGRLGADVSKNDEYHDEHQVQELVPFGPIAD